MTHTRPLLGLGGNHNKLGFTDCLFDRDDDSLQGIILGNLEFGSCCRSLKGDSHIVVPELCRSRIPEFNRIRSTQVSNWIIPIVLCLNRDGSC